MQYEFDKYFNIEEVRKQCKVWHELDDTELEAFALAALEMVSAEINRPIYPADSVVPCYDDKKQIWPIGFNARIRAACLLIISDLYENREANLSYSTTENRTLKMLLDPMRFISIRWG